MTDRRPLPKGRGPIIRTVTGRRRRSPEPAKKRAFGVRPRRLIERSYAAAAARSPRNRPPPSDDRDWRWRRPGGSWRGMVPRSAASIGAGRAPAEAGVKRTAGTSARRPVTLPGGVTGRLNGAPRPDA